jgi:hypothetical protein
MLVSQSLATMLDAPQIDSHLASLPVRLRACGSPHARGLTAKLRRAFLLRHR